MDFSIEQIGPQKFIIIDEGNDSLRQIPLEAIASWGTLLGLTDTEAILNAIVTYQEPADHTENIWGPLYGALQPCTDEMARAGVPSDTMEVLLDPVLGSPVPGSALLSDLQTARSTSITAIDACPADHGLDLASVASTIDTDHAPEIESHRASFLDSITPSYTVTQVPSTDIPDTPDGLLAPIVVDTITDQPTITTSAS